MVGRAVFHSKRSTHDKRNNPVDARGGVVSGRVISVLAISFIGAVVALVIVWFGALH